MGIYKKSSSVDIKGMESIHKGSAHKSYHGKTGRVYNGTQHAVGTATNKQAQGRRVARRINVGIEHMMHSKS
jgi:large subunit ribosomal protein L21e